MPSDSTYNRVLTRMREDWRRSFEADPVSYNRWRREYLGNWIPTPPPPEGGFFGVDRSVRSAQNASQLRNPIESSGPRDGSGCVAGSPGCNCRNVALQMREMDERESVQSRMRAYQNFNWQMPYQFNTNMIWVDEAKTFQLPDIWRQNWLKLWKNLGVLHVAAVYMKEVHYDAQSGEITNEAQLLAAL